MDMGIRIDDEVDCDVNTELESESDDNYEKRQYFTAHSNEIENDLDYPTVSEENSDKLSGRRIVDISYLFKQMQDMTNNICKTCNSGEMIFEKEFKKGLMSIFTFRCTICEKTVQLNSCPPKNNDWASVNESSVLGIVSIGLGYYHHRNTEKFGCENHIYKYFNKKCGNLHTNTKLKLKGRKLLPLTLGENISKGFRMAAKHWRESDNDPAEKYLNLENDIMNAPLHYFGIHDDCADYFCNKITDPEARGVIAVLKETGVYYELLDICQYYLANNAKSLIAGYSKTLGGKRVCNSLDGDSYKSRTAIADVNFNTKGHSGSRFLEYTFGNSMQTCLKMENTRKRKVASNALVKEINSKKPKLDEKAKKDKVRTTKHYGVGHQEVDLSESVFEAAKNRFLERLVENQSNRNALLIDTKAQRHSFKWEQVRRNMLTSSYFGRILKANNRKSYTNIIEEIIHKNVQYSNTAQLRHQSISDRSVIDFRTGIRY